MKESYGGLRDLTVMRALAASWIISPPQSSLSMARLTLLDTRDALHSCTGRTTDRLTQQEQPQVAAMLGYADEDELLRAVCAAGRTISFVSSVAWGRVRRQVKRKALPRLRRIGRAADRSPLAEGVVVQDSEVVLAADARPTGTRSWCCGPPPPQRRQGCGFRHTPSTGWRRNRHPCRYLGRGRHGRIW